MMSESTKDVVQELGQLQEKIGLLETECHTIKSSLETAQQTVQQSEARFQAVPHLVWSTDRNGSVDYVNSRWYEYTGQALETALGEGWAAVLHPEEKSRVIENWQITLQSGEPLQIEYRMRRADGEFRWFLVRAVPYKDEQSQIQQWFGTCTDIEDQKQAEQRLEILAVENARLYEEAQEAIRLRDEFLLVASHELRTPLTSLKGYIQLLKRLLDKPEIIDSSRTEKILEIVNRQSERLEYLISQMLDISRLETGRLILNRQTIDIVHLIENVVATMKTTRTDETGIVLEAHRRIMLQVDPLRIEQVLTNLLSNAVKFSPPHDVVKIEVSLVDNEQTVCIIVVNKGQLIAEEHRPLLFERFSKVEAHNTTAGLGLGLYISRQIVELHGGTLTAEFPPDETNCFKIALPMHEKVEGN